MVAESGAVLLEPDGEAGADRARAAARRGRDAEPARGAGADRPRRERRRRGAGARGPGARARTPSSSPAATATTGGADLFFDGEALERIEGPRHPDGASHGSGCTHSSALAAHLALGRRPLEAAREAREVAAEAVAAGLRDVGEGAGPVDVLGIRP